MMINSNEIANNAIASILSYWTDASRRNEYLNIPHMELYVRKGFRPNIVAITRMLDISRIIIEERFRGRAIFTKILDGLEKAHIPIYVENVHDERFRKFFDDREYERELDESYITCHYFLPTFKDNTKWEIK